MLPVMEIVLPTVSSNVPAFLAKLWKMVDDPETAHLISWSDEGNSFIIHHQADFAQKLLPYYYKHSNMASFVRQLNMYGFHKVLGIDSGGLKSERQDQMEFAHPYFIKNQGQLLDQIKRKVSAAKNNAALNAATSYVPNMKSEHVTEVLNEVSHIKDKQDDLDGKLDSMKKENEALWREVLSLRQKHQSQQKIVNKLIQFLVSLVQPRMAGAGGGTAVKRRYNHQLAIEGESPNKEAKLEPSATTTTNEVIDVGGGPIIKDVTHQDNYGLNNAASSSTTSSEAALIETPYSPMQLIDPTLINPLIQSQYRKSDSNSSQPQPSLTDQLSLINNSSSGGASTSSSSGGNRPVLHREVSREEVDLDMNMMQKDLDNLKDILSGQVTFDSSIISNIFNPEEPLFPLTLPSASATSAATDDIDTSSSTTILDVGKSPGKSATLPILFELDTDEPTRNTTASSSTSMNNHHPSSGGKKSWLKIPSTKSLLGTATNVGGSSGSSGGSELNTPAIYIDEDQNPLLSELSKN